MYSRAATLVATITALATHAASDVSKPPTVPEASHPALPLPLTLMPLGLRASYDSTALELPRIGTFVCGRPDVSKELMDDDPEQGGREMARALSSNEITIATLRCRRELAKLAPATSTHTVVFGKAPGAPSTANERNYSLTIATWAALDAFPATSTLGRDASALVGYSRARCFTVWGRSSAPCDEGSPAIAQLQPGVWLAGDIAAINAFRAAATQTKPFSDELELLAATRNLETPSFGFDGEVDTWSERVFAANARTPWFQGRRVEKAGAHWIRGVIAPTDREAQALEIKLRETLGSRRDKFKEFATAALAPCKTCKTAYDRYLHVLPLREQAALDATTITRSGRMIEIRHPHEVAVPALTAAQKPLDAERARRAKLIVALVNAWADGRAPTTAQLRAIGGEALVRTIADRTRKP